MDRAPSANIDCEVPDALTAKINAVAADIHGSVLTGSLTHPIRETKALRGQVGIFATKINHKYRMIWKWTDAKQKTAGITVTNFVASDKQNLRNSR